MAAENRGPEVAGVTLFFVVLTSIIIPARVYCRTFLQRAFGWDDFFSVLAWVCMSPLYICPEMEMRLLTRS